jgi:hypothetical protein
VIRDRPGLALRAIAEHVHRSGDAINSYYIKKTWLEAILASSGEQHLLGQMRLNCLGSSVYSIYQHLKNHSSFTVISTCQCGTFYYRDFYLEIGYSLEQLLYISDEIGYHKINSPSCSACHQKRLVRKIKSDPMNWLMPVAYYGNSLKKNESPPLSRIPQYICVGGIDFKLAFISYSQSVPGHPMMQHQVSLQLIRGQWYLYDV